MACSSPAVAVSSGCSFRRTSEAVPSRTSVDCYNLRVFAGVPRKPLRQAAAKASSNRYGPGALLVSVAAPAGCSVTAGRCAIAALQDHAKHNAGGYGDAGHDSPAQHHPVTRLVDKSARFERY